MIQFPPARVAAEAVAVVAITLLFWTIVALHPMLAPAASVEMMNSVSVKMATIKMTLNTKLNGSLIESSNSKCSSNRRSAAKCNTATNKRIRIMYLAPLLKKMRILIQWDPSKEIL